MPENSLIIKLCSITSGIRSHHNTHSICKHNGLKTGMFWGNTVNETADQMLELSAANNKRCIKCGCMKQPHLIYLHKGPLK
jgi:hypothetical protein